MSDPALEMALAPSRGGGGAAADPPGPPATPPSRAPKHDGRRAASEGGPEAGSPAGAPAVGGRKGPRAVDGAGHGRGAGATLPAREGLARNSAGSCVEALAQALRCPDPLAEIGGDELSPEAAEAAALEAEMLGDLPAIRALQPYEAAAQLLRLQAPGLVRVLLAVVEECGGAPGRREAAAWVTGLLGNVAPRLGLLEIGVVLAAVHLSFSGRGDIASTAAAVMLPPPTVRLRCLLLHWTLRPHLKAAALPAAPAGALREMCIVAAAAGAGPLLAALPERRGEEVPVTALPELGDTLQAWPLGPGPPGPSWMGLRLDPGLLSQLCNILLACSRTPAAGAAPVQASERSLASVARGVVRELQPMAPSALLLAGDLAGGGGTSVAAIGNKLLPLLVLGACGRGAKAGPVVCRAMWEAAVHPAAPNQRHYAELEGQLSAAAARLLLALPPEDLSAVACDMTSAAEAAASAGGAAGRRVAELCVGALAAAGALWDEPQLLSLLAPAAEDCVEDGGAPHGHLPDDAWLVLWDAFVAPDRGSFCPASGSVVAVLSRLPAGSSAGSGRLAAAWECLARAHGPRSAQTHAAAGGRGRHGGALRLSFVEEVLSGVLVASPLRAGAAHLAAAMRAVAPEDLPGLAGGAALALNRVLAAWRPGAPAVGRSDAWRRAARELRARSFEDAPYEPGGSGGGDDDELTGLCVLRVAASVLSHDELPDFMVRAEAAAAALAAGRGSDPLEDGQAAASGADLAALYSAAASGRDSEGLQRLLLRLAAARLPQHHLAAMMSALSHRMTAETYGAVASAMAAAAGADAAAANNARSGGDGQEHFAGGGDGEARALGELQRAAALAARAGPGADPGPFLRRAVVAAGGPRAVLRPLRRPDAWAALPLAASAELLALLAAGLGVAGGSGGEWEWEAALSAACRSQVAQATAAASMAAMVAADAGAGTATGASASPQDSNDGDNRAQGPRLAFLLEVVRALRRNLARPQDAPRLDASCAAALRAAALGGRRRGGPRHSSGGGTAVAQPLAGAAAAAAATARLASEVLASGAGTGAEAAAHPAPERAAMIRFEGAARAARVVASLLAGPEDSLPDLDAIVPAVARAAIHPASPAPPAAAAGRGSPAGARTPRGDGADSRPSVGDETGSWQLSRVFASALSAELPRLPLARAALALALLQPVLAAPTHAAAAPGAGPLRRVARAAAEAHGRARVAAALEALWFERRRLRAGCWEEVTSCDGGSHGRGGAICWDTLPNDVIMALQS